MGGLVWWHATERSSVRGRSGVLCGIYMETSMDTNLSPGQHTGEIEGKLITLEYFDTEDEMLDKIAELNITIPTEEL